MTDKYGSDAEHPEGTAGHAGENETWNSEPPVDDFHAGEDAATVSEETEMPDETGATETVVQKKSKLLPIAAGAGGLLILGAALYWQFGSPSAPSMPVPQVPPLSTQAMNAPPDMPVPAAAPPAIPAAPADVAPTTGLSPVSDAPPPPAMPASPSPAPVVPDATAVALPPKPMPAAMPMPAPVPTPSPVTAAAPQPAPAATPANAVNSSIDARLTTLSAHVDDLQKSLTQATQQLSQVSATLAANSPSTAGSNASTDERLSKIEQKLMQMQHGSHGGSHISVPTMAATASSDMTTEAAPQNTVIRTHTHKTHAKTTASVKTKKSIHMASAASNLKTPVTYNHWVLRAATPDEAWVATDATSPELRHVQVGDNLSGIGTVQSIRQDGDNWVVQGSKGSVQ